MGVASPGTWLKGITAADIDIEFFGGVHFIATQEMTEEMRQDVTYQGAFGTDGPILRRVKGADEGSVSFSVVLTRDGVDQRMNDESILLGMTDFEIKTTRGDTISTWTGCNWNRVSVRSTLDNVTLDADVSVPGWNAPNIKPTTITQTRANIKKTQAASTQAAWANPNFGAGPQ